jgi:hypothetical protein
MGQSVGSELGPELFTIFRVAQLRDHDWAVIITRVIPGSQVPEKTIYTLGDERFEE